MKYCKVCRGFRKNSAGNRCLECNEHSLISKSDRVIELGELVNQLIERAKSEGEVRHFIKELEEINKICQEFQEIQRIEEENEIIVKKIAEELINRAKEIINQQNQNRARQIVISSFRENGELSKLIAKELEIKLKELQKELGAKLESLPNELKGELGLEVERMFGRGIENLANNLTERVNVDNLTSAQSDVASLYKQLIEDLKAGHEEYKLTKESLIKEIKDAKNQIQEEFRNEQIEHSKTKQTKEEIINKIKQILDLTKIDLLIEN